MGKLINKNVQHLCDDSDGYMSLYAVGDSMDSGRKPIIFIRGHAGKYTINTKSILDHPMQNNKLIKAHDGFYYDEVIHFPIIGEFAYKDNMERGIQDYDKALITTKRFADSIIEMIEKLNLHDVDMLGSSVGANICMLCSKSERIDRVSAVSPTIPYSYLADSETLKKLRNKSILDRILYQIAQIYLDHNYGFVEDMNSAFRNPDILKELIDINKIYIEAGNVYKATSTNPYKWFLETCISISASKIRRNTGLKSDGAVSVDEKFYNRLGTLYSISSDNYHVWCDQGEKILTKAYHNLEKIHKN